MFRKKLEKFFAVFVSIQLILSPFFPILTAQAAYDTPVTLGYEGQLTDASNEPVDDTLPMVVDIYNAPTGGTLVYTQSEPSVVVVNGYFQIDLGPLTLPFDEEYYIELTIDGTPLTTGVTQRSQINSVAYSMVSRRSFGINNDAGVPVVDASDAAGDIYYDTTGAGSGLYVFDGTLWQQIGGAGADITSVGDVASGAAFDGTAGNVLQFEGTTADANEISLTGSDATSDQTIILPDASGVVVLSPGLAGAVNSFVGINNGFEFEGAVADGNETQLVAANATGDNTVTIPDATGTLVLDTTLADTAFVQNGNSFGGVATLGTNDNFDLNFETNGTTKATLQNDGDFAVDTNTLFIDAANNMIGLGTTTPSFKLELAGTATTADRMIGVNGTQVVYLPDQAGTAFDGSLFLGNGGSALSHVAGADGQYNTGVGIRSLLSLTTGFDNTAVGTEAMRSTTTGTNNSSLGYQSLYTNNSGSENVALGVSSLFSNTTGQRNVAVGANTLLLNSIGDENVAIGYEALNLATGSFNVAVGRDAGADLTTGVNNTFLGYGAGLGVSTGNSNTIIGSNIFGLAGGLSGNIIIGDGNGNQRINVDSSGNVGFGDTTPDAKLDVELAENTEAIRISDTTNTDSVGFFTGNEDPNGVVSGTNGSLYFRNDAGNQAVYINTNGGTSWTDISSVSTTAFINGGNSFAGVAVLGTNDANSLSFETGGVTSATIDTAGDWDFANNILQNIGAAGTDFTATGGLTLAGAFTANGTTTFNGQTVIGDNGDTVTIDSSDWNISATGDMTGIGSFTNDGNLTFGDTNTDTITFNAVAASSLDMGANTILNIGNNGTDFSAAGGLTLADDLTVTGNDIIFGNAETISNATDGVLAFTSPSSTFSGALSVDGNTTLGNATTDTTTINGATTISSGANTPLSLTRTSSGQFIGMTDGTDTFGVYNRAGTPEGNITADAGSLAIDTTSGALYVKTDDGDNTDWQVFTTSANAWVLGGNAITSNQVLGSTSNFDVQLQRNGSNYLVLNDTAIDVSEDFVPTADNALDLGIATTNRFRTGYFGTSVVIGATTTITDGAITQSTSGTGDLAISTTGGTNGDISLSSFGDILLDSTTTGTISLGDGNSAKTISIANGTAANTVNIATENTVADTITVGSALDTTNINGTTTLGGNTTVSNGNSFTANGQVTLGDNGDTVTIDSSDWNISATGDMTGIGALTMDGNFSQTGATTFSTGTGAISFNGATSVTGSNTFDVGTGTTTLGGLLNVTGNTTLTGDLAVNGDDITSDGATLTINAAGAVDIQDALTADSLTLDTAGITLSNGETITNGTNGSFTFATNAGGTPDTLTFTPNTAGAATFSGIFTTADLTADRTYTYPDISGTIGIIDSDLFDFDDFEDTLDLDAATEINLGANALTIDLDSTGDFSILDAGAAFVTFADDGSTTYANDIALNGGDLTTTAGTATLFNTGATTLNIGGAATTIGLGAAGATVTGGGALTINSGAGTALTVDSGTTGALNLGTGASAKTVTIGNTTGATAVNFNTGTGGSTFTTTNGAFTLATGTGAVNISADATANTVNLATGAGAKTVSVGSTTGASSLTLSAGTGAINIGTSASARSINIGTGAGVAQTIAIGGTGANPITIGNTQTAGAVTIGAAMTTGNINIGGTGAQTGAINIGTGSGAQNMNYGTGTGAKTIQIGGTGANTIGIGVTQTAGTITLGTAMTTGSISIGGTGAQTGSIQLGTGTGAQTIDLATGNGAKTTTLGSTNTTSTTTVQSGTGGLVLNSATTGNVTLDSGTTGTVNLGTGNNTKTINLGTGTAGNTINIGTNNSNADTIAIGSALDTLSLSSSTWGVSTTGLITAGTAGTAATPAYSFFGDADTGLYRAGANTLGISTAGVAAATVSNVGVFDFTPANLTGTTPTISIGSTGAMVNTSGTYQTSNNASASFRSSVVMDPQIAMSDIFGTFSNLIIGGSTANAITSASGVRGVVNTTGTFSGTITDAVAVQAAAAGNGSGTTLTNVIGFQAQDQTVGTNRYAFQGNQTAGANFYNLYMGGGAQNYMNGNLGLGDTSPAAPLTVGSGDAFQVDANGDITMNQATPVINILDTGTFKIGDATNTFLTIADQGTYANFGLNEASPNSMLSVVGTAAQALGDVGRFTNLNTAFGAGNSVLELRTGATTTGACVAGGGAASCPRYVEFFSAATTDNNGTAAGRIAQLGANGVSYSTGAADFGEFMVLDSASDFGDIVGFGGGVRRLAQPGDVLLGVVSGTSGFVGNGNLESTPNANVVGLIGVVETKVNDENGPITEGDPITISSTSGEGMLQTGSGYTVGYALADLPSGSGTIDIFVSPKYTDVAVLATGGGGGEGTSGWFDRTGTVITTKEAGDDLTIDGTTTMNGNVVLGSNSSDTLTFNGSFVSDLDLGNNLITNIGNAGTDFTSGGGLMLAADLTVSGNDVIFGNGETISNSTNGTIAFTDGTNTLLSIIDQGTYGTLKLSDKGSTGDPATCTAGEIYFNDTDNQVKACVSTNTWVSLTDASGIAADSLNYTDFSDSLSLDATTTTAFGANNNIFNLDSTGDFIIQDNGVAAITFADDGSTTLAGLLTANGTIALGDNGDTVAINSNDWDISATGDMTGIGSIALNGNFTQTGATTFSTGTGALSLNGATSVTGTNTFSVGTGTTSLGGLLSVTGNQTNTGDLAVNGGDITSTATTLNVAVGNTGTINFTDGTNTLLSIADAGTTGNLTVSNNGTFTGDLAVNGADLISTAATLRINAAGTLDVQDILNADSLTLDTGDVTLRNTETIANSTDDLIILGGSGGTNNVSLTFDLDGAGASVPSLSSSANDLIAINDSLTIGIDGATTENIALADFAFAGGNDLYVDDKLGVNGNASIDGELITTTFSGSGLTDCDSATSILLWDATTKTFSCGVDNDRTLLAEWSDSNMGASLTASQLDRSVVNILPGATSELEVPFAGEIVYMSVAGSGARTGGSATFEVYINGAASGFTCVIDATNTQYHNCSNSGDTFAAGDTIDVRTTTTGTWGPTNQEWAVNVYAQVTTGADLAELYNIEDSSIEVGDVVSVLDTLSAGIKKAGVAYDNSVMGVISTKPGHVLGIEDVYDLGMSRAVALSGRVPVKVSTINGDIEPGDYLTTSTIPGVAMKATRGGAIIGTALSEFSSADENEIGIVTVFIKNGYANGAEYEGSTIPPALNEPLEIESTDIGAIEGMIAADPIEGDMLGWSRGILLAITDTLETIVDNIDALFGRVDTLEQTVEEQDALIQDLKARLDAIDGGLLPAEPEDDSNDSGDTGGDAGGGSGASDGSGDVDNTGDGATEGGSGTEGNTDGGTDSGDGSGEAGTSDTGDGTSGEEDSGSSEAGGESSGDTGGDSGSGDTGGADAGV